ncbi:hypothetical protein [Acetobacterium carbinolicum]|uniref:hypothetical protein n=1 Tax=Acetobacterium carbinolicum TaxID=52690 RepID=UPI003BF58CBB
MEGLNEIKANSGIVGGACCRWGTFNLSAEKALENMKRVLKKDGLLIVPNFVRHGSRKEWLTEKAAEIMGFHTYHPWKFEEYCSFIQGNGLKIETARLINGVVFPLAFVTARMSDYSALVVPEKA